MRRFCCIIKPLKKASLVLILLLSCFSPIHPALCSAWVREKGEFFLSPQISSYTATQYFDKYGNKQDIGYRYIKQEANLYGEYGLTEKDTLFFQGVYDQFLGDPGDPYPKIGSTAGTITIGGIHELARPWDGRLSAIYSALAPIDYSLKDEYIFGPAANALEFGILFGRSFDRLYFDSGISIRKYFGNPSDQLRDYVTAGYDLLQNVQLTASISEQKSQGNGTRVNIGGGLYLDPDFTDEQGDASLVIKMSADTSLVLGCSWDIYGRNVGDGNRIYLSLWRQTK